MQEDKSTCFWFCLWLISKTTSNRPINKFSRSSISPWLCPNCLHTHTCTAACIWPCSTCRHTYNLFIRQTDTPTLPSIRMQISTAAQQTVAEMLQYAVCLSEPGGKEGIWKWVKAFRRRPQHPARSSSAVVALCRSITIFHIHPAKPPAGAKSYLGRVQTGVNLMLRVPSC